MASLAVKMDVGVLVVLGIVAQAQFIPCPLNVLNGMDEVMFDRERPYRFNIDAPGNG